MIDLYLNQNVPRDCLGIEHQLYINGKYINCTEMFCAIYEFSNFLSLMFIFITFSCLLFKIWVTKSKCFVQNKTNNLLVLKLTIFFIHPIRTSTRWLSAVGFNYKPGTMWTVINSSALIGWNILSSLNVVITANEESNLYQVTWL